MTAVLLIARWKRPLRNAPFGTSSKPSFGEMERTQICNSVDPINPAKEGIPMIAVTMLALCIAVEAILKRRRGKE